jgi:IS1 family transposase
MKKLSNADRVRVIAALVEGCSIRATVRMTGIAKNTVAKLLVDLGGVCARYMGEHLVNLNCKRIQVDEIWAFCYSKQKNVPEDKQGQWGYGDVWTYTALDADTKLMVSWMIGKRDATNARVFMEDVAYRVNGRIQLTTDGHRCYIDAVEGAFGADIDYAMLVKVYGEDRAGAARYSPAKVVSCHAETRIGDPDIKHVSTSFVERSNLTMRMSMRRFTRLTNGFSKKVENHEAAVAIHMMQYNFCRVHQTLRVTPAMAAGIADHVWELSELAALVEKEEQAQIEAGAMKRGAYKKTK